MTKPTKEDGEVAIGILCKDKHGVDMGNVSQDLEYLVYEISKALADKESSTRKNAYEDCINIAERFIGIATANDRHTLDIGDIDQPD